MPAQNQETQAVPKFNLVTHNFDGRGRLRSKNTYRMHVQNGAQYFERPVGSGNLWYENNEPAGRVEFLTCPKGIKTKSFDFEATHKSYAAPISGEEKLHFENADLKTENAALRAEMEAIRAEQTKRTDKAQTVAAGNASALAAAQTTKQSERSDGLKN